jgi:predicted membrane-bound spermidine synthase
LNRNPLLLLLVFVAGAASLGAEITASRLVGPFFGTSVLIWAVLIGNTLIYLTLGYALGGRLADRSPQESTLYMVAAWAGFALGVVPFIARPILLLSVQGFATYDAAILLSTLVGFNLVFAAPTILLGMVSPFAIRLALGKVRDAGSAAGSVYALSTLGSIIGAYAPVFLITPRIGSNATFVVFAALLLLTALWGMARGGIRLRAGRLKRPAPLCASQGGLRLLVFVSGIVSLAVELTASRVLGPYFGTSVQIWVVLIGLTLNNLTLG